MPNRCGCANACSCLVVAGDGISVEGIGTLENPYEITSESSDLVGRVEFTDDGNVDFTTTGVGTINDPLTVFADAVLAMSDLTDVPETEPADDGDILVWRLDGWVYEQPAVVGPTLPPGGTDGQVLTKQSSADGDADWETFSGGGGGGGGEVVLEPSIIASYWRTAAMTGVVGATTILWDTPKTPAEGITYTPATGVFAVLTSGWYLITTRLRVISANSVSYQVRLIDGTGAFIDFMQDYATTSLGSASLSKQVYLAAGSTFQVYLSGSGTGVDLSVSASGANAIEVSRLDRGVVGASAPGKTVLEPTYAAARRHGAATSIPNVGSPTIVTFDTEQYTDGIPWASGNQFTVPVDGYYQVDATVTFAVNGTGVRVGYIYVGSAPMITVFSSPDTDRESSVNVSGTVYATAGNYITIRVYQSSGAALTLNPVAQTNWVSVHKVPSLAPGGGGVVVERPVAISRKHAAATSMATGVQVAVPWDTDDSNDGFTVTGPVFTIPSDGWYDVTATCGFSANGTGYRLIRLMVNGATTYTVSEPAGYATENTSIVLSRTTKFTAGDLIQVNVQQNSGATLTLIGGAANNFISITKVPQAYAGSAVSTYGERNYYAQRGHGTATSIPNATTTPVPFDTGINAENIVWNGVDGFTVPVDGYYNVEAVISYSPAAAGTGVRSAFILLDGSSQTSVAVTPNAGSQVVSVPITQTIKCVAGQKISIGAYQTSGAALNLAGGAYARVSITKVPAPVVNGAAASGVWPVGELSKFMGSGDYWGREVYIDSKGQLRGKPDVIYPTAKAAEDLIETYPMGVTLMTLTGTQSAAGGWPTGTSSQVVTFLRADSPYPTANVGFQIWCRNASTSASNVAEMQFRSGNASGWTPWMSFASAAQGAPVNCAAEVKMCTDVSSTPNAGSVVNYARYTKVGKTVTYWGAGTMGSAAVPNGCIFLPPSAGVPAFAHHLQAPGIMSSTGVPLGRAMMVGTMDRAVSIAITTSSYYDFPAGCFVCWNFTYEVA